MKLLDDKIAVKPEEQPDVSAGGIVLPDAAKAKPVRGEVVEVGLGFYPDEQGKVEFTGVDKGDTVIFSEYAGVVVEVEDQEYVILRKSDILVVL